MYTLVDAREMNRQHPESFYIPEQEEVESIKEGTLVKLGFKEELAHTQRMWVEVTKREGENFTGMLRNEPYGMDGLSMGDEVKFEARHLYEVGEA